MMEYFLNNPAVLQIALSALAAGALLGGLVCWLIFRSRQRRTEQEIALLQLRIKTQDVLQLERDSAFEVASGRLARAFSDLANQSLKSNSENFLRLAEQNLGAHQEKAKRELSEREQAVENLVKPIREALQQSQRQISELEKARSEAYGAFVRNWKRCSLGNNP
jgi:DNA recombination protein RmuC